MTYFISFSMKIFTNFIQIKETENSNLMKENMNLVDQETDEINNNEKYGRILFSIIATVIIIQIL